MKNFLLGLLFLAPTLAWAASPVNLYDAAGHPLSSTFNGGTGQWGLNINGSISATNPAVGPTGSAVPAQASYTGVKNGSGNLVGLLLGQQTMANSLACVLPSDQSAIPVTESGTWTVQPGNTANTTAWLVTGTGGTFPATESGTWNITNISGTVSLPTGASTSALQTTGNTTLSTISGQLPATLGAKTTANSMAVTIASDQTVTTTDAADGSSTGGTAGTKSALAGGIFNTVLPTLTTGQQAGLQLDSSGRQIMGTSAATIGVVNQGTAAAVAGGWPVKITDGTSTVAVKAASTAAVAADPAQVVALSPNNNTLANALFTKTTDGTNTGAVKAASTAAVAADPAQVVALSPNNNTLANALITKLSDGTNTTAVKAASTAAVATDPAVVVALSPNNGVTISPAVTGSGSAAAATVSTVATLTAPANATGFILQCLDTSTANIRWAVGRTATTTLGQQLQPGRDTGYVPIGANVSIVAESGTQNYDIQWIAK